MLDTLAKMVYESGPLVSVAYLRFDDDPNFVTAVGLRFESMSSAFRAVEDDDTLAVSLGNLSSTETEELIDSTHSDPWSACLGLGLRWAWRLTNQQGYSDGVRLEFGDPDKPSSLMVEMTVAASAIQIFEATRRR
jgi:hypothetical protein